MTLIYAKAVGIIVGGIAALVGVEWLLIIPWIKWSSNLELLLSPAGVLAIGVIALALAEGLIGIVAELKSTSSNASKTSNS